MVLRLRNSSTGMARLRFDDCRGTVPPLRLLLLVVRWGQDQQFRGTEAGLL